MVEGSIPFVGIFFIFLDNAKRAVVFSATRERENAARRRTRSENFKFNEIDSETGFRLFSSISMGIFLWFSLKSENQLLNRGVKTSIYLYHVQTSISCPNIYIYLYLFEISGFVWAFLLPNFRQISHLSLRLRLFRQYYVWWIYCTFFFHFRTFWILKILRTNLQQCYSICAIYILYLYSDE